MTDHWYHISDLPAGRVTDVEVYWNGRQFRANYMLNPKNRMQWCVYKDGSITWLPPKNQADAWGAQPQMWRPTNAKWTWPGGVEPTPLPVLIKPRLVSLGHSYDALTDAEMAAERKDMRHEAEARSRHDRPVERVGVPWWRDSTRIRYQAKGEITREMAEGRVMRVLANAGPSFSRFRAHFKTTASWLESLADERSAMEREAERVVDRGELPKLDATPEDGRDFLTAMGWFTRLATPEDLKRGTLSKHQRVLLARSGNYIVTWIQIAFMLTPPGRREQGKLDYTYQAVQQMYESAIDAVWRCSNGHAPYKGVREVDLVADVRDANRAHKRRT